MDVTIAYIALHSAFILFFLRMFAKACNHMGNTITVHMGLSTPNVKSPGDFRFAFSISFTTSI